MNDDALRLAVRHNCWANLELIAFCAKLPAEQLAWTVPGTFGTIRQTLQHIVAAEQGYLLGLTGEMPPRGLFTPDTSAALDELTDRERSVQQRCERLLAAPFDAARVTSRPNRPQATAGVVISQLVHHGSDHRAHVGTILGAHGEQPPDLDVWAYGRSIGEVGEVAIPRV